MIRAIHVSDKGAAITDLPPGQDFATPEAVELAEAYLLEHDLEVGLQNMLLLQARYKLIHASEEQLALAQALFRDAVVQLVGCFGTDTNQLSEEEVLGGIDGGLDSIAYLKDLRNAYVAHRFGPARQCFIVIVQNNAEGFGFTRVKLIYGLPSEDVLPAYVDLIKVSLVAAKSRIARLMQPVMRQLEDLGHDGIAKLPPLSMRTPGAEELKMGRNSFRAGKKPPPRGSGGSGGRRP